MSEDSSDDGYPYPALPRPKRKIRSSVTIMSSTSGSDSDDSVGPTRARKRFRVPIYEEDSDSDGSSSSSSSALAVGVRSRHALARLQTTSETSESSFSSLIPQTLSSAIPVNQKSESLSDDSDGNSEKCPICLLRFKDQKVGIPSSCEHIFCLDCLLEWAKNMNTCPVDRLEFNTIIVRACMGGPVLRISNTIQPPVSPDVMIIEDITHCMVCGNGDREESLLLCDRCDLGYHMECLSPPLQQIPINAWYCQLCRENDDYLSVMEQASMEAGGPEPWVATASNSGFRPTRDPPNPRESSTSGPNVYTRPSITRDTIVMKRNTGTNRRNKRGPIVLVEYEVEGDDKFPISRKITVKRRVKKKRMKKRQPRTAERRALVRNRVRARIAALHSRSPRAGPSSRSPRAGPSPRSSRAGPSPRSPRAGPSSRSPRAGPAPPLSLFGSRDLLEYFTDEEEEQPSEGPAAVAAVALRPTSHILTAYRQARRKMVSISSPPRTNSSTDVLSSILERQSLLHAKNTVVSIAADGKIDIQPRERNAPRGSKPVVEVNDQKLDLSKGGDSGRKVPSYPGQPRGGGGGGSWGGNGGRGHQREQHPQPRAHYHYPGYPPSDNTSYGAWLDDSDPHSHRPAQYSDAFRRTDPIRRPHANRTSLDVPSQVEGRSRGGLAPSWRPHIDRPPQRGRRRLPYGGSEDARMTPNVGDQYASDAGSRRVEPSPADFRPLPEPPVFRFDGILETEKSDDERSDSGLVIDTEKYDPTDPTNDDTSGDEGETDEVVVDDPGDRPMRQAPTAGTDTNSVTVPPAVVDDAVKQVLQEHRQLIMPDRMTRMVPDKSDDDSDGDCPNFSIYSAASVHIANNSSSFIPNPIKENDNLIDDPIEDLIQEDVDSPTIESNIESETKVHTPSTVDSTTSSGAASVKLTLDYNEKVSRRCPITPNKRHPIKIKLNTPTLIKRQVSLYDEEEDAEEENTTTDGNVRVTISPQKSSSETSENIIQNESNKQPVEACNESQQNVIVEVGVPNLNIEINRNELDKISIKTKSESSEVNIESVHEDKYDNIGDGEIKSQGKNDEHDVSDGNSKDDEGYRVGKLEFEHEVDSEQDNDDISDNGLENASLDSKNYLADRNDDVLEKMTESISETEDERSYTPCLDENKSKDTSLETEKENIGIEGLDTEMISEEEGNDVFSDADKANSEKIQDSPHKETFADTEEGEILEKRKELADINNKDEAKRKKKKETKKDGKDKSKGKVKKADISFKKLSKSSKERNYRDKDKDERNKSKKDRQSSSERERDRARKREKRKDLERYDVRTVVTEKRRKLKDAFGRDISPGRRTKSPSASRSPVRRSVSRVKSLSPLSSPRVNRRSPGPKRRSSSGRRSPSRRRRKTPSPRGRNSISRNRKTKRSPSPRRKSVSPRRRGSVTRGRKRLRRTVSGSPKPKPAKKKKRSRSRPPSHAKDKRSRRVRRKSKTPRRKSPKPKKKKKSASPELELSPERLPWPDESPEYGAWSRSEDSRPPSPSRTPPRAAPGALTDPRHSRLPPPDEDVGRRKEKRRRRRELDRVRPKRGKDCAGPSKEVFTSGDNILVSVSFNNDDRLEVGDDGGERKRRRAAGKRERRERRRKKTVAAQETENAKPVAIIDLEKSPFRELTPSPKNVIVLSDSDHGEKEPPPRAPSPPPAEPTPLPGPKTPPSPASALNPLREEEPPVPAAPLCSPRVPLLSPRAAPPSPSPASSRDAYDPFEPTKSPEPGPTAITLETAQRTNLSADDVVNQRPVSPMEKVLALLQSTRDVSPTRPPPPTQHPEEPEPRPAPEPAPPPEPVRVSPLRQPPKLFLAKPSPIKSDPIKPLQNTKISKLPLPPIRFPASRRALDAPDDSPYSPGSSDYGDAFSPPADSGKSSFKKGDLFESLFGGRAFDRGGSKASGKRIKKKGNKTQVGVKLDDDNLKILDDLPSSAVEMQVKSKFLKKLNRQERVVEEVKLVLKPHYNKKRLSKDDYKDILRRAVPKICHNKSGEINPAKIQSLVEAYVRKFRKRHKLAL